MPSSPPWLVQEMRHLKRSVRIAGRRSSIWLEDEFWNALQNIAKERHETANHLVSSINAERKHTNLSSAIRLYVLDYYQRAAKK